MNDKELLEKIINKELTICETCDTIFKYVRQKIFCDECMREKRNARQRKYYKDNSEKLLAQQRKYYKDNSEKLLAQQRKHYAKKKQKKE
jgi:hypothetical protein